MNLDRIITITVTIIATAFIAMVIAGRIGMAADRADLQDRLIVAYSDGNTFTEYQGDCISRGGSRVEYRMTNHRRMRFNWVCVK